LCTGYTISRAILSDAIALTRGDRFFTQDYTPYNLTAWGFADCQRDPNAFGFGSTLGRLFLRTLPNHFTDNSVYTFFPFMTPDAMKTHLKEMKVLDQYDLARPKGQSKVKVVTDYVQVAEILSNSAGFASSYAERAARVINGKGYVVNCIWFGGACLMKWSSFYTVHGDTEQDKIAKHLADTPEATDKIGKYFYDTTSQLIKSNSFSLVGKKVCGVDIVRDVLRVVPVMWAAADIVSCSCFHRLILSYLIYIN
jgi:linoleate 10R-lipoxygenase